ncbi:hypothetical protein [Solibacillus silvestris]|nr:hypothetical protein [Solibacillus silvestris]
MTLLEHCGRILEEGGRLLEQLGRLLENGVGGCGFKVLLEHL